MFQDRKDAGRRLAALLTHIPTQHLVVLGLPRGGVPVAAEVADALGVPLDVIIVRKLGVPSRPELAMGAIGEDGVRILNEPVIQDARITASEFARIEAKERVELARRAARFRGGRDRCSLVGRTALIVDDGIATGSTVRAACQVARAHGAERVIVAAPVAPPGAAEQLRDVADEVIVLASPVSFLAIGQFYDDFAQTSDDEVIRLLERGPAERGASKEVTIDAGDVVLPGHLTRPEGTRAIVLFVHGSGSSRHSPRNRFVADVLNRAGLGTLLFDLLTPAEARDRNNVFDIELLARRLTAATKWLAREAPREELDLGYFGASTGAASALWAAADPSLPIGAVVSRGGRPDLAGKRLGAVRAPTLFIVGGNDRAVLALNREAQAQMCCETSLSIVPGATHLFEEPGTLAAAADLACDWLVEHLVGVHDGS